MIYVRLMDVRSTLYSVYSLLIAYIPAAASTCTSYAFLRIYVDNCILFTVRFVFVCVCESTCVV